MRRGSGLTSVRNKMRGFLGRFGVVKDLTPLYQGEKHVPMANFMGPGTHIEERLQRGDKGVTESDELAKEHDISYMKIKKKMQSDKGYDPSYDVMKADTKLIKGLEKSKKENKRFLNQAHAKAGLIGMNLKKIAENLDVISPKKFVGGKKGKSNPARKLIAKSKVKRGK